jgi:hypothetical protein
MHHYDQTSASVRTPATNLSTRVVLRRLRLRLTQIPIWEEDGQSVIIVAVVAGIFLLGFLALGLDVGYVFHEKRIAQAAADAAAVAVAEEASAGNPGNEQTVANAMAKLNGFDPSASVNPATVTIKAPTVGNYAGAPSYLEVDVSKPVPTILFSAFSKKAEGLTVVARAVAGGGLSSPTCICLEASTGNGLGMTNNAQINAPQCGVTVDSNDSNAVQVEGSATLNAFSLGTISSTWDNNSNVNNNGLITPSTRVVQGVSTACHPMLATPTLPNGLACNPNPIQGFTPLTNNTGVYTLPLSTDATSGGIVCYTSLDTSDAASVTLTPGYTYYIQGDFTTGGGAPVTGNGVQMYIGGNVDIANGVTANLTAPTVSGVPQTLFWAMGGSVVIEGGSTSVYSGLVYAPNAAVTLDNGTGTTLNLDFVAQTLTMAGGATLNSYATTALGTLNLSVAKLVE